jgi:type I restriction enzyme M protein
MANVVREHGGDARTLKLSGQEVSLTTAAIARMNLFLHDIEDFKIVRGDTLRSPGLRESDGSGAMARFDVVIANPPFSLKNWGAEVWKSDPWGRAVHGLPPAGNGDLAWVQHMVASMKRGTGRVGVVMPHGVLFRGGAEKAIRTGLLEADLLEAVVGLPGNLFYSTSIPACLLIFRGEKLDARRGHVLFVDGSKRFTKGRNQNQMAPEDVDAIVTAFRSGEDPEDVDGVAVRLVPLAEIKENDNDLNLGRYLRVTAEEGADVETALAELRDAQAALRDAEAEMWRRLEAAGYA